jgi:hypothetical protein
MSKGFMLVLKRLLLTKHLIKYHGQVINIPALYTDGFGYKSGPETSYADQGKCWNNTLNWAMTNSLLIYY